MSDERNGFCVVHENFEEPVWSCGTDPYHLIRARVGTLIYAAVALGLSACISEQTPTEPSTSAVAARRAYMAVDLGVPGENSEATDINPRGQIVGRAGNQAAIWEEGRRTELGFLGGAGCCSRALGINPVGEVVGTASTASGDNHAFLWRRGVMTDLGTLGGDESFAAAINPAGEIVGGAVTESGNNQAFLWRRGVMRDLGTIGRVNVARDISPSGQVVGEAFVAAGGVHAFVWRKGVPTDLGTLGGENSLPMAINSKGQVVGSSNTNPDEIHAFLWEKGGMKDLGLLGGVNLSFATDINAAGQVVGYFVTQEGLFQSFLWDRGLVTLLDTPPGGSSRAEGINDGGDVVGSTQLANGETHATLWTRQPRRYVAALVRGENH